jgi:hypothetical protein
VRNALSCDAGAGAEYRADSGAVAAVGLVRYRTTPSARPLARRGTPRNDSGQERRTDVPRAPRTGFWQGLGRKAAEAPSAHPNETAFTGRSSRPSPSLPNVSHVAAIDSELARSRAQLCSGFIGEKSKGSRRPRPYTYVPWPRSETAPLLTKSLQIRTNKSGRPDLNRGPHRPERCALPGCATPRGTQYSIGAAGRPAAVNARWDLAVG